MYNLQAYRMEESIMDILNTVFSALNLLANVVHITWTISKDIFQDKANSNAKAKHYSKCKKD